MFGTDGVVGESYLSSNNVAVVTGTGSVWSNANTLYIGGSSPDNQLIVTNGGSVISGYAYVGLTDNANNNVVIITGANSMWTNNNALSIGAFGAGNQLIVTNGGQVINGYVSAVGILDSRTRGA